MKMEAIKVNPNQKELTPKQKVVAQKILKAIQKRNQKQHLMQKLKKLIQKEEDKKN